MNLVVHLLPVGELDLTLLGDLRAAIPRSLPVDCEILPCALDPTPCYHAERQQYHSSQLLERIEPHVRGKDCRVLAVADVDLYIPILKYVFGEAQMGGPCAVISAYRLRQEFYGLAQDDVLFERRLLKEAIHELGHTFNLHHCEDYRCAMASSHAVEWIDLRESRLCNSCYHRVELRTNLSKSSR